MNTPARAFMALEEWQKRQLEAVVLCYDVLKEQGLLRGFACIGDTRAYTDSFVRFESRLFVWWGVFCCCSVGGS